MARLMAVMSMMRGYCDDLTVGELSNILAVGFFLGRSPQVTPSGLCGLWRRRRPVWKRRARQVSVVKKGLPVLAARR